MRLVNFAPPDSYDWTPPRPVSARRTEPFAIVALILGVLACFPIAIPFAAAALVRIKRSGDAGRALAIAGLVMSIVFPLAGAGVVYGGVRLYESFVRPDGYVAVDHAEVGDCVNGLHGADYYLPLVSCDSPHEGEFLGTVLARDDDNAEEGCADLLEDTTADDELSFLYFAPADGRSPCYMVHGVSGGKLVGSGASARPAPKVEEQIEGKLVHATALPEGRCAKELWDGDKEVRVVSCAQSHEGVLRGVFDLSPGPWPGEERIERLAAEGCEERFGDQIKGELWAYHPASYHWIDEQRVACYDT
ncbi:hypothetical protein GCM10010404_09870 [Nonomuraea africana]